MLLQTAPLFPVDSLREPAVSAAADTLAADAVATTLAVPPVAEPDPRTGVELLFAGGWTMVPLLLLLVLVVLVVVERVLALRRVAGRPGELVHSVGDYIRAGDLDGALRHCRLEDAPPSRVVGRGLERVGRPIGEIREAVQATVRQEAFEFGKRGQLPLAIAAIAPLLGLLGTATALPGALERTADPLTLATLGTALRVPLLPAIAGLGIGVLAVFAYFTIAGRTGRATRELEAVGADFLDLLQTPARPR